MNREREKMGYWYYLQKKRKQRERYRRIFCNNISEESNYTYVPKHKYGVKRSYEQCSKKREKSE